MSVSSIPSSSASSPSPWRSVFRAAFWRWLFRLIRNRLERVVFYQPLFLLGAALCIGVLCGFAAVGFHHLIAWFGTWFWGGRFTEAGGVAGAPWWMLLLIPALGGLLVGPVIRFVAPEAKGHGVPEVMLAMARSNGVMRGRVVIGKALTSALTIASGGSAGREGPIIQIGGAIGSKVGQLLRASAQHLRTFAGCGAAAGLAATFNAPIAATLFVVEVLIGEYTVMQFTPIVIASVMATVISRHFRGSEPVFNVPEYDLVSGWEFGPYLMLGLLCGVVALGFMKALFHVEDAFERWRGFPRMLKPAVGGLLLGVVAMALPQVMADGYGSVDAVLHNQLAGWLVALLLVAKVAGTSLTLGSGGSGGVFMPSLFLGAMTGALVGQVSSALLGVEAGSPGGYALVGMGGVVAGAMHAPITAMVMMFELTGNYSIILPLMSVCILSTLVTTVVKKESIYTMKLARAGIDLFRGRTMDIFRDFKVADCMTTAAPTVKVDERAGEVLKRMLSMEGGTLYVIDENRVLHGTIRLLDLRQVMARPDLLQHGILAMDLADSRAPVCRPVESLRDALLKFEQSGLSELPVADAEAGRLIGVLPYKELIVRYNEQVLRRDTDDAVLRRLAAGGDTGTLVIAPGLKIRSWRPPPPYWGKALADLDLPQNLGIQVVLIRRAAAGVTSEDAGEVVLPGRHLVIGSGDVVVVCGRGDAVDSLPGGS